MNDAKPANSRLRTLVISPNWIGDAVMAQPLLQALKRQAPDRPIDVLAPAWVAPVWRAMSEVAEVMEAPFKHGSLQLGERWRYARMLKARGYADAYVLPNTLKFALIPWLAGIPKRVGYCGEKRYGLINTMHFDDKAKPRAMVPFYAALAEPPVAQLAADKTFPRPILSMSVERQHAVCVELGLRSDLPLVVFAPGAEFGSAKRWPTDHFAALAKSILERDAQSQVVLLGSPKDKPVCEDIVALAPTVRSLAGVTSLDQAIALIAQARAVVSNDSGLLHIASACNRPIIAIYGPTDPLHAPPFSDVAESLSLKLECSPCKQRECPLGHHDCMRKLEPVLVWGKLEGMLGSQVVRG